MKTTLVLGLILISSNILASSINCRFTEPFIIMNYNSESKVLVIDELGSDEIVKIENIKEKRVDDITTDLISGDTTLVTLTSDGKGNDGMSDEIMPISALAHFPKKVYGGCK